MIIPTHVTQRLILDTSLYYADKADVQTQMYITNIWGKYDKSMQLECIGMSVQKKENAHVSKAKLHS